MSQYDPHDATAQLLRRSESGIRAYILCRLGDPEGSRAVYEEVRNQLASGAARHLATAPSLRAVAYATARELALSARQDDHSSDALAQVPWLAAESRTERRYVEILDRMRAKFSPAIAEVLELKHARTLELSEIAYVVGLREAEVEDSLTRGEAAVRALAPELIGSEVALSTTVADAFRPDTSTKDRQAENVRTEPPRLREGTVIAERFEVVSTLAAGQTVSSFLASDLLVPGDSVVVNVLGKPAPTIAARNGLLGKLRRLELTADPAIERTLTYGWLGNRLWYATPWYTGETLADIVADRALSLSEAQALLQPIWRGLATLHERGIVHRNVSPENIRLVQVGPAGSSETHTILCGAYGWLTGDLRADDESVWVAPELAKKFLTGSKASEGAPSEDVFSLALTTLQSMVPAIGPPVGSAHRELLGARAREPVEVPESAGLTGLRPLLEKALSVEPTDRPDAAEIAKRLATIRKSDDPERSRRQWVLGLAAGALALALFAFVYFVRESRLDLLDEAVKGAETQALQKELEAEQKRSRQLELRVNEP